MAGSDQLGIAALVSRLDDADRLPNNTSGDIAPTDARDAFEDTVYTLQNLRQYQLVCYYTDGTRTVSAFTDGTDAGSRFSELSTWLGTLSKPGTAHIPPGLYQPTTDSTLEFDQDDITYICYGAVFKRKDNSSTGALLKISGDRNRVIGLEVDGNRANNTSITASCDNVSVTGDDCTLQNCFLYDTPRSTTSFAPYNLITSNTVAKFSAIACDFRNPGYANVRHRARRGHYQDCWHYFTDHNGRDVTIESVATDTITSTAHALSNGNKVFVTGDTLPTGIDGEKCYFVVNAAADTFQLERTVGAGAITISDAGTNAKVAYQFQDSSQTRCFTGDLGSYALAIAGGGVRCDLPLRIVSTFDPAEASSGFTGTVNTSTDTITAAGHNFSNGTRIRITAATSYPSPTHEKEDYYVQSVSGDDFKLSYYPDEDEDGLIDFDSAGVGTLTFTQLYLGEVSFDQWHFDVPHWVNSSDSDGLFKFVNCENIALRALKTTRHGKGDHYYVLNILGGSGTFSGFRPHLKVESCQWDGGIKMNTGAFASIVVRDSTIGPRGPDSGLNCLQNLAFDYCRLYDCILRVGDFTLLDLDLSYQPGDADFFADRCVMRAYTESGQNRYVITSDSLGGGFSQSCALDNRGTGNLYWANGSNRRLTYSRVEPRVLFYQPHTLGTGTGTASNDHPTDPTVITGRAGETMLTDGGGIYIWDVNAAAWDVVRAHT